jgi:hypothetical protein
MKTPRLLPVLAALLVSFALAGCLSTGSGPDTSAGSIMRRIDANRAAFESWPLPVQNAIFDGKAIKGMNAEQVRMALGEPIEVLARGRDEVWVYKRGEDPETGGGSGGALGGTSIGIGSGGGVYIGGSRGGGGTGTIPMGTPAPGTVGAAADNEIVFRDGLVIRAPGQR